MTEAPRESWIVLLHRAEETTLYESAAMAASATSLGIAVTLVWFDAALEALVGGALGETGDESTAAALLASARATGLLRSLACSASAVNRSGGIAAAREAVDDVVGWPTVISLIRGATRSFVW
ncbi:MAG: hypothetical protein ABI610_03280 [Acidobacteriota bacterium]